VTDSYRETVRYLEERYYRRISRYASSAFMRVKLGQMLSRRLSPRIFENRDEAQSGLSRPVAD
jgi:propionate CoA-transferase